MEKYGKKQFSRFLFQLQTVKLELIIIEARHGPAPISATCQLVMSTLSIRPVIGLTPQSSSRNGDRRKDSPERRKSSWDRRLTAHRRSGLPDRRRLQTAYLKCRRQQIADRRRMNRDRRFHDGRRPAVSPSRYRDSPGRIPKGQLIDIAV